MREADETTRQQLTRMLRAEPATPSELAVEMDLTPHAILGHLEHVSQSVDTNDADERFLVAPPACRDCGFDNYDDLLNLPSRCPSCKSESIAEPTVTID
ncbi:transcriptional regulator [Natronolimnobius sp. AArcel1]|uniref:transcriptional regulator n=1 Tax=Natronolimnobius sp. AArcel1 TaxID=1679093 RepID=UPI0013EBD45F|nr:transcriptional regulator [Natronolimnobius sp. AArcel1]NGM69717.1 transcriptional regulator [Natronolimnobius sp. AArcel1]